MLRLATFLERGNSCWLVGGFWVGSAGYDLPHGEASRLQRARGGKPTAALSVWCAAFACSPPSSAPSLCVHVNVSPLCIDATFFCIDATFFFAKLTCTLVFCYDSNAETLLLTGSYKSQFLWWEAVILLRKLSLKCVVVFINSPITQGCGCLLFSFVLCCAVLCSAQCLNKNACQIFPLGPTTALQPWRAG